jgi:thiol-disulfide isomerase/thioredoxin
VSVGSVELFMPAPRRLSARSVFTVAVLGSSFVAFAPSVLADQKAADAPAAAAQAATKLSREEIRSRVQGFYKVYETLPQFEGQPTPEQMETIQKTLAEAANKALEGIDLATLDTESLRGLGPILQASPDARAKVSEMFTKAAAAPTAEGFAAAVDLIQFSDPTAGMPTDRVLAALDHPGAVDGFRAGKGRDILFMLDQMPPDALKSRADRLASLAGTLDDKASNEAFFAAPSLAKVLSSALSKAEFEPIRSQLAKQASTRAEAAKDEQERKMMSRVAARLNGAELRGELVGFPAPKMTFSWVRPGENVATWSSLGDLKGKVVVLDFWATWCGPCVASFPQIKELRAEFPTDQVEIIGVTSLQGRVFHRGKPPVDCKGDAAKEKAEMEIYAKDMGVTWTIAMTEEDVFNPDFGIDGIPFVAIIGPDGKVAKTGLHPMNHDEIKSTIAELLKSRTTAAAQ